MLKLLFALTIWIYDDQSQLDSLTADFDVTWSVIIMTSVRKGEFLVTSL